LLLQAEAQTISKASNKRVEAFTVEVRNRQPYTYEMKKTLVEGKCVFLEGTHCRIYELRPLVCRFYPFRLTTSRDGKHRFHNTSECPGIGKGEKLTNRYFEELLKKAHLEMAGKSVENSI